jgi:hypothetical protein
MAKKVRTPPPPRKVQAPKVRTGRERGGRAAPPSLRERLNLWYGGVGVVALAVAVVLIVVFATKGGGKPQPPRVNPDVTIPANLPGLLTTKPPWGPNNGAKLLSRLQTLGIPELGQEQLAFHIHQHLDLYNNGKPITVPAGVGIHPGSNFFFADLHTHAPSNVIHVESAQTYDYTLGQFFGVWGVRLTKTCLGGLCGAAPLNIWVDGIPFFGDPTKLVLFDHEEIVIAYGTPPTKIPHSFDWGSWNGA